MCCKPIILNLVLKMNNLISKVMQYKNGTIHFVSKSCSSYLFNLLCYNNNYNIVKSTPSSINDEVISFFCKKKYLNRQKSKKKQKLT